MKKIVCSYLVVTGLLIAFGFLFIYSSSFFYAEQNHQTGFYFVYKQLVALALGILLMISINFFSSKALFVLSPYIYLFFLFLSICPMIPGIGICLNGAKRWINLGFFLFQPSELLKSATILYAARLLENMQHKVNTYMFIYLFIVIIPFGILLLQPDFGQAFVLFLTCIILLFIANCSWKNLLYLLGVSSLGGALLIIFKSYRLKRLLTFLNPWKDPKGSGFQIIQSLIAIYNGKIMGIGIAQSRQKFLYLPMQHTDFIFSIICEETGLLGVVILLSFYFIQYIIAFVMAFRESRLFNQLVIIGNSTLIMIQANFNIFVATGSVPTKGIVLPFISYGSSSLIGMCCLIGVTIACSEKN